MKEPSETLTRLACCAAAALVLCAAAQGLSEHEIMPWPEGWAEWLHGHKLHAAAAVTVALYALSLLLFPPEKENCTDETPPATV